MLIEFAILEITMSNMRTLAWLLRERIRRKKFPFPNTHTTMEKKNPIYQASTYIHTYIHVIPCIPAGLHLWDRTQRSRASLASELASQRAFQPPWRGQPSIPLSLPWHHHPAELAEKRRPRLKSAAGTSRRRRRRKAADAAFAQDGKPLEEGFSRAGAAAALSSLGWLGEKRCLLDGWVDWIAEWARELVQMRPGQKQTEDWNQALEQEAHFQLTLCIGQSVKIFDVDYFQIERLREVKSVYIIPRGRFSACFCCVQSIPTAKVQYLSCRSEPAKPCQVYTHTYVHATFSK